MSNKIFDAVRADDPQAIEQAIKDGENINALNNIGNTPAINATRGQHHNALQALIDNKADLNIQDTFGNTPLMWAVQDTNAEAVAALLKADNIDINLRNNMGLSAVETALSLNKIDIAVTLIEHGADTSGQLYGMSFEEFAEMMSADKVLEAIEAQEQASLKETYKQAFNVAATPPQPASELNLLRGLC